MQNSLLSLYISSEDEGRLYATLTLITAQMCK